MKLGTRISYFKWHFKDYCLFPLRRQISCFFALAGCCLMVLGLNEKGGSLLMKADRIGPSQLSRLFIKMNWQKLVLSSVSMIERCNSSLSGLEWINKRSLILKDPIFDSKGKLIEKGVYLVKFTTTFPDVFEFFDLPKLQSFFHVVLEPSWAGYCLPEIVSWGSLKSPVWVEASEVEDRELLELVGGNLIPVEFGSGDWVDPDIFFPLASVPKEYDVVYVANFNSIKRQYVFLKVLKELKSRGITLNAALVCGRWGEHRAEVLDLLADLNLTGQVSFYEGLSQPELNVVLNKSKVNILLSLKEGSNRSLFEGFFADVPGVVLESNVGVNKSYFNSETGCTVKEKDLAEVLVYFSKNWESYSPRKWALRNISPQATTEKMVSAIQKEDPEFLARDDYLQSISVKVNSPEAKIWAKGASIPRWNVEGLIKVFGRMQDLEK